MVVTGNTPSRDIPEYYGTSIEWIKWDTINTPNHFLTRGTEGLSDAGKMVGRIAPEGSILVTCIAGSPDCIGNAAIADRAVAFNQQINALVPTVGADPVFLYSQFLLGKRLIQAASTQGMKGIVSKSRFEAIEFMVLPLSDQRQFAAAFAALQSLRQRQTASATQLDALFASLQHRAFRGEL